jgi:3-oxosteroid 1-dehydrogenase
VDRAPSPIRPDSKETADRAPSVDVIIVGTGAAGLSAALLASVNGASVLVLEKSGRIGGSSAMSGAGTWIPANHHARAAGIEDSIEEALGYVRAASPEDWHASEDHLWRAFVEKAPESLEFLEKYTPLRFRLVEEPDPQAEKPGGKVRGRMLSPLPLSRRLVGKYASKIRRPAIPHLFTYQELRRDPYSRPLATLVRFGPRLLARLLTDSRGQGSALITGLLRGCLDHGCRIELEARVQDLLSDAATGRVVGVVAEQRGQRRHFKARRGVLLATGGFEWDPELRKAHFGGHVDRIGTPATNTGDGQKMASRVGASLARMDQANLYPLLPIGYEGGTGGLPALFQAHPHAIVVDRAAQRFVSEYDYNIGEALDRRDPASGQPIHLPCWVVGDARFLRRPLMFRWLAHREKGWVRSASTIAGLAGLIGLPPAALERTIERFNGFARAGEDKDFRRGESIWERYKSRSDARGENRTLGGVERPPFVAVSFNRAVLGTKGGARTNERGQVLRPDGSVIPGLYCAGNAMANPFGTRAVGAGTSIGPCLAWGYICALGLLRENQ